MLGTLAKDEPEKYAAFWKEFGAVLKEGVAEDHANRDELLPLLRFASTHEERRRPGVSLADYVGAHAGRARSRIYYVSPRAAPRRAAVRSSSSLQASARPEVLLLGDRIDGWIMGQLQEFEGKSLQGRRARRPGSQRPGRCRKDAEPTQRLKETRPCSSA